MKNKQTAVEWVINEVKSMIMYYPDQVIMLDILEKAKKMEKGQTVESWDDGNFHGRNGNLIADYFNGEQYYKEIYDKD